jgi:hypothetical protein
MEEQNWGQTAVRCVFIIGIFLSIHCAMIQHKLVQIQNKLAHQRAERQEDYRQIHNLVINSGAELIEELTAVVRGQTPPAYSETDTD